MRTKYSVYERSWGTGRGRTPTLWVQEAGSFQRRCGRGSGLPTSASRILGKASPHMKSMSGRALLSPGPDSFHTVILTVGTGSVNSRFGIFHTQELLSPQACPFPSLDLWAPPLSSAKLSLTSPFLFIMPVSSNIFLTKTFPSHCPCHPHLSMPTGGILFLTPDHNEQDIYKYTWLQHHAILHPELCTSTSPVHAI